MRNLNAMAIFVEVVRAGSFSSAAKKLGMPLSTVSRKVSDLESHLGVKLLERTTRSLRLTEVGAPYANQCERALQEFEEAERLIAERQTDVTGVLRISTPPNLADILFTTIIETFQASYPKAAVRVFVTERNIDFVQDGVDLAFRVGQLSDSSLVARKIATYRHLLVASPDYLQSHDAIHEPSDLLQHGLIAFGAWGHHEQTWTLLKVSRTKSIRFSPKLSVNDYSAIERVAIRHQGVAEIPSIICAAGLRHNALVEVLPDWQFRPVDLQAVHTGTKNMSKMIRLFLDASIAHLGEQVRAESGANQ